MILIVTEGAVTEPEYLCGLAKHSRNPRVRIKMTKGAAVPTTIVKTASEIKETSEKRAQLEDDDNLRYDEVWCVFDVDQHPDIPSATQVARENGLKLAISNPCIELWLWLHFSEQPGMKDGKTLRTKMRRHLPKYDKHVDFSRFVAGYQDAVRRASRLDSDAEKAGEPGRNPTTGVWRLTETIRNDS